MLRFPGEVSDSESENSSASSDKEVVIEQQGGGFQFDSSSSEEDKRVVRSLKDKRYGGIHTKIAELKHHLRETDGKRDWVGIAKDYEDLKKLLAKAKNIVQKEGIPKFYVKALLSIKSAVEDFKKAPMKLNKINTKAVNGLKQKMKQLNKDYAAVFEAYLKDPLISEEEKDGSDSSDSSDSSDDSDASTKSKSNQKSGSEDENANEFDDASSTDWEQSESSSSSDTDDIDVDDIPTGGPQYTREYWMKKPKDFAKDAQRKASRIERQKKRAEARAKMKAEKAKKKEKKTEEKVYSAEMIVKKLKELMLMRGKRSTDRKALITDLEALARYAKEPVTLLKVKVALVSAYFESNLNRGQAMKTEVWKKCVDVLKDMLATLAANTNVRLSENAEVEEEDFDDDDEDFLSGTVTGNLKKNAVEEDDDDREDNGIVYVAGNFYSFLFRLGSEFTRSLREADQHVSVDYVQRLGDEKILVELYELGSQYYKNIDNVELQAAVVLSHLEVEFEYYQSKYDVLLDKTISMRDTPVVQKAMFLYNVGDGKQRTRALLAHVSFLSIHNHFAAARDLLLMSHVQDAINEADISTRIMFNRTMARLGVCAFHTANYTDGMACLADLHQSQRIKELLAQGISSFRHNDRDEKQEKIEKKRQMPYHLHMNLDTLESVHLIGAMFAEVENLALGKRRVVNKIFRRNFDMYRNNNFNAPPENTRDLIMHAATSLIKGNWRPAVASMKSLRLWAHIRQKEHVQGLLVNAMKELALRLYLITYGASYISLSLSALADQFELPERTIHRNTSKMMLQGALDGVWDEPSKTLLMHVSHPSRLQRVALGFADKAIVFVEQNERYLDQRHGYYSGNKGTNKWGEKNRKSKAYNYRRQ